MSIKLDGINCFYGAHQALFDITLQCPEGETLVLLGPSGAGKSSLLRVLNLLEMPEFNHQVQVERGVLEEECSTMLSDFFRMLRKKKPKRLRTKRPIRAA